MDARLFFAIQGLLGTGYVIAAIIAGAVDSGAAAAAILLTLRGSSCVVYASSVWGPKAGAPLWVVVFAGLEYGTIISCVGTFASTTGVLVAAAAAPFLLHHQTCGQYHYYLTGFAGTVSVAIIIADAVSMGSSRNGLHYWPSWASTYIACATVVSMVARPLVPKPTTQMLSPETTSQLISSPTPQRTNPLEAPPAPLLISPLMDPLSPMEVPSLAEALPLADAAAKRGSRVSFELKTPPSEKELSPKSEETRVVLQKFASSLKNLEPPPKYVLQKTLRWKKGAFLGSGAFGGSSVHLGLNEDTGELMAVKNSALDPLDTNLKSKLLSLSSEIAILKKLDHVHIVKYFFVEKIDNFGVNIFMEYVAGGSIQGVIQNFGSLPERVVVPYTHQILLGLAYLHKNSVVHGDMKGANVLLAAEGFVKLADFGASTMPTGTPTVWMAPEAVRGTATSINGWATDVWSLGATVMEMMTGKLPWSHIGSSLEVMRYLADDECEIVLPEGISEGALSFFLDCFQRCPEHRPSAEQLLEHHFFSDDDALRYTTLSQDDQHALLTRRESHVTTDGDKNSPLWAAQPKKAPWGFKSNNPGPRILPGGAEEFSTFLRDKRPSVHFDNAVTVQSNVTTLPRGYSVPCNSTCSSPVGSEGSPKAEKKQ